MRDELNSLLAPIPGENPAGEDLRYSVDIDRIKRARRAGGDTITGRASAQSGPGPEHHWQTVESLTSEALAQRSKDLQLAVWLLEAETRLNGFDGAAFGLELVRALIDRYWDSLHPLPDEDDDEPLTLRANVMSWITEKLPE